MVILVWGKLDILKFFIIFFWFKIVIYLIWIFFWFLIFFFVGNWFLIWLIYLFILVVVGENLVILLKYFCKFFGSFLVNKLELIFLFKLV